MKTKILVLSMLLSLLFCFSSFAETYRDVTLPAETEGKFYFMVYDGNHNRYVCYSLDEKPDRASVAGFDYIYRLYRDDILLSVQMYLLNDTDSSRTWVTGNSVTTVSMPYGVYYDRASVYNNFPITLGTKYGFFPYAPLPISEMAEIMRGAEIPVMVEVVGLIPLLIPCLVGLLAFWKGWTWLRMQLSGV